MWTPEQRKQYMTEWRSKNPTKVRKQSQSWRDANMEYDKKRKQEWYLENKEKVRIQRKTWGLANKSYEINKALVERYGITIDHYNELLKKQNECCAICNRPANTLKRRLCVDHNHSNGKIRGLLCWECNYGLGYFKDNSASLLRATTYLAQ